MNNFSKNILILTPGFAKNEQDTACLPYLQDFILALKNRIGAEKIKILTIFYPRTKNKYLWHGIEVIPIKGRMKNGFRKLFLMFRLVRMVRKLAKQFDAVMHSFWVTEAAMVGHVVNKKEGIKHVCTAMGQDVSADNFTIRYINLNRAIMVTLSKNQDDIFLETTGKHSDYIIPLPLPEIDPANIRQEREIDLLFAGSFIPLKHPEVFVRIIKRLAEKFPGIKAVMMGEGPLLDKMKETAREEHLQEVITFTGVLQRPEVFKYMGRSKILLHPSEYEGQCLVFSEALAHGMYVVSYHVGRIEDSDKHMIGWSEEELFLKCERLLTTQMNFEPYCSLDTNEIIDQYLSIYNS